MIFPKATVPDTILSKGLYCKSLNTENIKLAVTEEFYEEGHCRQKHISAHPLPEVLVILPYLDSGGDARIKVIDSKNIYKKKKNHLGARERELSG